MAAALAVPTSANVAAAVTDETGSGSLVFANTPTLITPILGTPTSVTLTNATGLPIGTGVSGLGTGVAAALATPTSANVATAVTDETGSGALVFATGPTLVAPALGTPSVLTLTNATGLPVATGISGLGAGVAAALATPSSANLATAVWEQVEKTDECWVWRGTKKPAGYGIFWLRGRSMHASRAAYVLTHGPIADEIQVCHRCDNPPCVRPDHLFPGTPSDNMRDAQSKGSFPHFESSPTKLRSTRSKLSPDACRDIARRHSAGESNRTLARAFGVSHVAVIQAKRWASEVSLSSR